MGSVHLYPVLLLPCWLSENDKSCRKYLLKSFASQLESLFNLSVGWCSRKADEFFFLFGHSSLSQKLALVVSQSSKKPWIGSEFAAAALSLLLPQKNEEHSEIFFQGQKETKNRPKNILNSWPLARLWLSFSTVQLCSFWKKTLGNVYASATLSLGWHFAVKKPSWQALVGSSCI